MFKNLKGNIPELEKQAFNISGDIGKEIFPTIIKSKIIVEDEIIPELYNVLMNLQNLSTNKTIGGKI